MAKNSAPKKSSPKKTKPAAASPPVPPPATWPRRLGQEMTAILLLGLAGFLLLALGSHSLQDPQGFLSTLNAAVVKNAGGKAGALVAAYCLAGLGLAAFWLPLLLLGLAWQSHRRGLEDLSWPQAVAALGLLLATAGLLALGWPTVSWGGDLMYGGGSLGKIIAHVLRASLNPAGAVLALALVLLISFMGVTRLSYVGLLAWLGQGTGRLWRRLWRRDEWVEAPEPRPRPRRAKPQGPVFNFNGAPAEEAPAAPPVMQATLEAAPAKPKPSPVPGKFTLPPLDLLDTAPPWNQQVQEGAMVAQAQKLEDTLRHFGVEGRVTAIMTGPVVSRFEYEPALGVKISKITGLADDLALALKALSIRIVAPVPGKGVLGIEVPNPKRQVVALREILSDGAYQKSASRLTLALGKDIMGAPVVTDLAKMPHLLIAGATGLRQERRPQRHDPEHLV